MYKTTSVCLLATTLLLLSQCKSKKESASAAPATDHMQKQVAVAERRWPGTTEADLQGGQTIYRTRCNTCHKNFEITRFSEKKWLHELDVMSPKAKLTDAEKEQLTRFILSYRETFAAAETN